MPCTNIIATVFNSEINNYSLFPPRSNNFEVENLCLAMLLGQVQFEITFPGEQQKILLYPVCKASTRGVPSTTHLLSFWAW